MSHKDGERIIGRWFIRDTLGKGGYSFVKKGVDIKTSKVVALKFMEKADASWIKEQAEQVETEIEALKNIRHKNVMKLYAYNLNAQYPTKEVNKFKDVILLVLEHAPGGELFDILYYTSKLDPLVARTYFKQLIDGVEACHKANVIHRDLKPQNLLLDGKYNLKITDFGLSKVVKSEADHKMDTYYVGTRGYQAPELLLEQDYDLKCDVFSCGVILFILLAGYPPFEQASKTDKWFKPLIKENYEKFWKYHLKSNAAKLVDAKQVIQNMLTFDPKKRWTVQQIKESDFYQGETLKHEDLVKYLRQRHKATEEKRLEDVAKQLELKDSINPHDDGSQRDIIKDGFCEIFPTDRDESINSVYTWGDKDTYWKTIYAQIIVAVQNKKGMAVHDTQNNLLKITMGLENKGELIFTFKVWYSNVYKKKELGGIDDFVYVAETRRISGDIWAYHAVQKQFILSTELAAVLKGLPKWARKQRDKNLKNQIPQIEQKQQEQQQEVKDADDDYYNLCTKIDY